MNKFLKSALAVCAIVPCAFTFGACGKKDKHQHTYSDTWSMNETHHWYGDSCGHGSKLSYTEHDYDNEFDKFCNVCGYDRAEYSVWNGEVPETKPESFTYDLNNRHIYIDDASAFAYFAWKYNMLDEYEARNTIIEEARNNDTLEAILVKDESDVAGENCFKSQYDWTVILNANIDLDNNTISPIKNSNFRGFEGQNHIIKNFTVANSANTATGLFAVASNNLTSSIGINEFIIKNATITSTNAQPAGIIGETNMAINNIHAFDVEIIGLSEYVGTICGRAYDSVTNCSVTNINIEGVGYVGGIIGKMQADEGAGALELDNLYVENAKIVNTQEASRAKLGAIVGCVENTSTRKLDSLTIQKSNSFKGVVLMTEGFEVEPMIYGINTNGTCIVR